MGPYGFALARLNYEFFSEIYIFYGGYIVIAYAPTTLW